MGAQYGYCYWHRSVPHRVGIRRDIEGVFKGTYVYCPVCRPDGRREVSSKRVRPRPNALA